jgi:hypothetical protein
MSTESMPEKDRIILANTKGQFGVFDLEFLPFTLSHMGLSS